MQLDILAFAAHPDDIELSCSGTLMHHIALGKKVGIVDLTRGELGSRGTPELRDQEAIAAAKVMGIHVRENLGMEDGFFENNKANQRKVIQMLRKYRPRVVLANSLEERHPDHPRGAQLLVESCFKSGLRMIKTKGEDGNEQDFWRPKLLLHYMQDTPFSPEIVVDISPYIERKLDAIKAFRSQFHDPSAEQQDDSIGPQTYISSKAFLDRIYHRASELGRQAGYDYAEGFKVGRILGVKDLCELD